MKKLITAMLCLMIAVCGCGAGQSSTDGMGTVQNTEQTSAGQSTEQASEQLVPEVEAGISKIDKYGNIFLTIGAEAMEDLGYETADIIRVRIKDIESEMPIGTSYTDADSGEPVCCFTRPASGPRSVALVINSGSMAEVMGIARKQPIESRDMRKNTGCDIIALDMSMDLSSEDFRQKLARGYRFLASHEGPYLIHCNEGKDRTGYAAAILECLMGADAEEVIEDYMLTYCNFYGIEPGSEQYEEIADKNIVANLEKTFRISSIRDKDADLQGCAEAYLKEIGLSGEEISALKERLSRSY